MNKKIVYTNDDGTVAVIVPTAEWLETHTIEELAVKAVPDGKEHWIVDASEIPSDRTFRNAWEWA